MKVEIPPINLDVVTLTVGCKPFEIKGFDVVTTNASKRSNLVKIFLV